MWMWKDSEAILKLPQILKAGLSDSTSHSSRSRSLLLRPTLYIPCIAYPATVGFELAVD